MMVLEKETEKELLHIINSYREKEEEEAFAASIRGFVGFGKTTLARHLYNHADIVQNFDHRVWVACTEILSHKELLINLLRQLPGGGNTVGAEEMEIAQLHTCVVQCLQGKQFFIVLDDLRRFRSFEKFLNSLCSHAKGRWFLLITCGYSFPAYGYEHNIKPLDIDKSWELLLTTMLLSNTELPKHVERKGKAMLMKHTGGVPLAIKEAAMEWLEKRRVGIEWEGIVESEDLELRETLEALDASVYHILNPLKKSFFQHLGFFKLGSTIRIQRYMDTFVASGGGGKSYFYRFLKKFVNRGVFEIGDTHKDTHTKNFRISPIFHKLSIKKANEGEDGALYRVIGCGRQRSICPTDRNEQINCLSFNGGGCFDSSPCYWKSFEQLKVLDFEGFGLKLLPETVGELIELRYLGLRNNYIQELPRSLGHLKKLEVLDIAQNFMVEVLDIVWEMDALVDLYMSDIFCKKPLKIEALKNLRTLSYISVDNWAYEVSDLQMMTNLQKLGIEGLDGNSDFSKLFASLAVLKNLDRLELRGSRFKSMPSLEGLGLLRGLTRLKLDGLITKLPCPPRRICFLTLVNCNLDDDPMPILERLPELNYLKLQNAYNGQQMVISTCGFYYLKHMCIEELWHLRNIQVGRGGLEHLKNLEITSCPYLHSLPQEIIKKKIWGLNILGTNNIATKTNHWAYKCS